MAIEIEKKYRLTLEQREQTEANLKEFGAEFQGEDFEINTLYSGGILDEKFAVLRIRKAGDKTILTYKQRIRNTSSIKHQIEHETNVESAEEIEKIIENLGFIKAVIYEKRRKTWNFRNVEVVLDNLPFGLFMEIEGSIQEITEAEMLLNAEDFEVELETYPRLTMKHGTLNEQIIEARFVD
jgi:adenylate cyclase class 2